MTTNGITRSPLRLCTCASTDRMGIRPERHESPMNPKAIGLELPSIGWLLFLADSSPNDWIASCPTVVTFATRLLTEPLTHLLPQPQCDGYSRQPPPHHDHRDGGGHADRLAQRVPALPDLLGLARIHPAL